MTTGRSLVVAVDVGSTTARAGVFDAVGHRLSRAEHPFATNRPLGNHAEHGSEAIWQAVVSAVRSALSAGRVDAKDVAGLAFDATCSLVLLDRAGRPVTASVSGDDHWNVVMWADHRAVAEAEEITATRHAVLEYVGGVMSPEMELPKLLWLKRNLPQAWARYGLALDLVDFLAWRATGRHAVSACTVTCKWTYLRHEKPGWRRDLFEQIGLGDLPSKAQLTDEPQPIGSVAGPLSAEAASSLGLTQDCIVGVGLIDAHAGGVGLLGRFGPSDLNHRIAMIAGTSSCHMAGSPDRRTIAGVWGPYYDAMLPGMWLSEAGQSASGALLEHILDLHAEGRNLGADRHLRVSARAEELLASEGPGMAGDLQIVPDFNGNRSPLADPSATGVIHGLRMDASFDGLARLYYATAVAIALGTRQIIGALNAGGYSIDTMHLTGGQSANPMLVRLYADATGCKLDLAEEEDSVLLGTASVAATAAALHPTLIDASSAMSRSRTLVTPAPQSHFDTQYRRFLLMQEQSQILRSIVH